MKRALILTNVFPRPVSPNTGFYIFEQVKRLKAHFDIQILVATAENIFEGRGEKKIDEKIRYRDFDIYQSHYPAIPKLGVFLSGYFYYFSVLRLVERIRKEFPFDLIVAYWAYPEGFAAVRLAKKFKVPVLVRPRGSDINVCFENGILQRIVCSALDKADRVIPVSEMLKNRIQNAGITPQKLSVIINGVNDKEFFPLDKQECRNKLQVPLDKKIVLFVGNLVDIKGVRFLADAIRILEGEGNRQLKFYILGEGRLEDEVKSLVREIKNVSVHLIGDIPHEELRFWMNAADVLCLPSLNEGCPNVVLEALACGVPVVATNVGGVPELINSSQLGILVAAKDAGQLADGIKKALEKQWNKEELTARVKDVTWEQAAHKLVEECNILLKDGNRK